MGIDLGAIKSLVLSLIGGFPLKIANKVVGDHMLLSKSTFPYVGAGALSGIGTDLLNQVLGAAGIGGLLQNPIGTALGLLQGAMSSGTAKLTAVDPGPTVTPGSGGDGGGTPATSTPSDISILISHINGLSPALNDLHDAAERLAGLIDPDYEQHQYGASDVQGHAALLGSGLNFGSDMSMDAVLGPLAATPQLHGYVDQLNAIVAQVVAVPPTLTVNEAMDAIDVMAGQINNIVAASNAALDAGRRGASVAGTASSIIADAVASSVSPPMQAYLDLVLQPAARQAIEDDKAARLLAAQQAQQAEDEQTN